VRYRVQRTTPQSIVVAGRLTAAGAFLRQ
jgi:hypothetical protein